MRHDSRERQKEKQHDKKDKGTGRWSIKIKPGSKRGGERVTRKINGREEEEGGREGGRVIRAVSWLRAQWKGGPQRRRGAALWERQPGALIPHNRFISQTVEALMRLTLQLALPSERRQELGNDDVPRWRGPPQISSHTDMKHRPALTRRYTPLR